MSLSAVSKTLVLPCRSGKASGWLRKSQTPKHPHRPCAAEISRGFVSLRRERCHVTDAVPERTRHVVSALSREAVTWSARRRRRRSSSRLTRREKVASRGGGVPRGYPPLPTTLQRRSAAAAAVAAAAASDWLSGTCRAETARVRSVDTAQTGELVSLMGPCGVRRTAAGRAGIRCSDGSGRYATDLVTVAESAPLEHLDSGGESDWSQCACRLLVMR